MKGGEAASQKEQSVKLNIQKTIANSQTTLPVVGVLSVLLWIVLPTTSDGAAFMGEEYGLWRFVPKTLQEGCEALGLGLLCAALAVYMMVELNSRNILLRVSSRMLSCMLAILLTISVAYHGFQPGYVVLLLSLLSFFSLFAAYQHPDPILSFEVFLYLSVASLVFPKLVWLAPLYWLMQGYFQAFSFRSVVASLLALLMTYWLYAGVAAMSGHFALFMAHAQTAVRFHAGDYHLVDYRDVVTFLFVVLLFVVGTIDFYLHRYLDRVRTRIQYDALCLYGGVLIVLICLQPQYADVLMPLLLVSTSMVFGHFFALTHTRFSHICCLVLLLLAVMTVAVQYVCDAHFHLIF